MVFSTPGHADNTTRAEKTTVLANELVEVITFVDANGIFCDAFSVEHGPEVQAAIANWYRDNRIDNVNNVIYGILNGARGGVELSAKIRARNLKALEDKVRLRAKDWCAGFPATLQSEKMNLAFSYTKKLQELNSYYNQIRAGSLTADNTIAASDRSLPTVESPLYQSLVDAKLDPAVVPISTEFRCYGQRPGADFNAPDFIIQLSTSNAYKTYKSTFGAGSYVGVVNDKGRLTDDLIWTGALSDYHSSSLTNNFKHGQTINFKRLAVAGVKQDFSCYQQGARERAAMTRFMLKEPVAGEYHCRDSEGERRESFDIITGYRYTVGDQTGYYQVDLRSTNSLDSEVSFVSGPLADTRGEYREQGGTGRRTFSFKKVSSSFLSQSSSIRLDMTCTSVGEAKWFNLVGDEDVTAVPSGSGGMSGLYATERRSDETEPNKYNFYVLTSEGHVFYGEPDVSIEEIGCDSTYPSGKPKCNTYRIKDDKIILNNGFRDYDTLSKTKLFSVQTDVTHLDGTYTAIIGETQGLCGPFSSCSSWVKRRTRQFTQDGLFSKDSRSLTTISSSLAGGLGAGRGSSNASDVGRYKIEGNLLHIEYADGAVETHFIAVLGKNTIHTGGWTYYRDNQ